MPLHLANMWEPCKVVRIDGPHDIRMRLTDLGFTTATPVCVVSRNGQSILVQVRGSRIMLNNVLAGYINVQ